jgi:HSP20 family molecular chaperone IbpA
MQQQKWEQFHTRSYKLEPKCLFGETKKYWVMDLAMPGVRKEDMKIAVNDYKVRVRGRAKSKPNFSRELIHGKTLMSKDEKIKWFMKESKGRKYEKNILLPTKVDKDKFHAELRDGILRITVEKPDKFRKYYNKHAATQAWRYPHGEKYSRKAGYPYGEKYAREPSSHEGFRHAEAPNVYYKVDKPIKAQPVVFEHVHPVEYAEEHIPHVHKEKTQQVLYEHVHPVERVEVHKHVHPRKKLQYHEHIYPRKKIDVHEHLYPVVTTRLHEQIVPEQLQGVQHEIYPEDRREQHRTVDLGEVQRYDRELDPVIITEQRPGETVHEKEQYMHSSSGKKHKHKHVDQPTPLTSIS